MLRRRDVLPGSQKGGWLGSIVPMEASTAATQSCLRFAYVASFGGAPWGETISLP